MKSTLLLTALIFAAVSPGAYANRDVLPELNQCSPVIDSKVYITTDFHAYPREVAFECNYKCNSNNRIVTVKGITRVVVSTMAQDASDTTCQGVMMKKVPWGYDFDKVVPFYAPDTAILGLKKWAFENINFDPRVNSSERAKLENLKIDLYKIAASLVLAGGPGSNHFREAGIKLSEIADGLPMNTKLLDETIKLIVVNKGISAAAGTSESIVFPMVGTAASWRLPTHLYK